MGGEMMLVIGGEACCDPRWTQDPVAALLGN